jgi:hypothetical protein
VRLPNTSLEFEITRRGVEVNAGGTRYVMYQERNIERDNIVFSVTVDGRWVCRVSQYGYDGTSTFEVLDKGGDPFKTQYKYEQYGLDVPLTGDAAAGISSYTQGRATAALANEKRKVLLLCP